MELGETNFKENQNPQRLKNTERERGSAQSHQSKENCLFFSLHLTFSSKEVN